MLLFGCGLRYWYTVFHFQWVDSMFKIRKNILSHTKGHNTYYNNLTWVEKQELNFYCWNGILLFTCGSIIVRWCPLSPQLTHLCFQKSALFTQFSVRGKSKSFRKAVYYLKLVFFLQMQRSQICWRKSSLCAVTRTVRWRSCTEIQLLCAPNACAMWTSHVAIRLRSGTRGNPLMIRRAELVLISEPLKGWLLGEGASKE